MHVLLRVIKIFFGQVAFEKKHREKPPSQTDAKQEYIVDCHTQN